MALRYLSQLHIYVPTNDNDNDNNYKPNTQSKQITSKMAKVYVAKSSICVYNEYYAE